MTSVIPSTILTRDEVWWKNFHDIEIFYKSHGHLSLSDSRLSSWLSYQRHHASSLDNAKIDALESIGYKSTAVHREKDVKIWEENFSKLLADPTVIKQRKMKAWFNRQCELSECNKLCKGRKKRLLEKGFDLTIQVKKSMIKKSNAINDTRWMHQYEKLKKYQEQHGNCDIRKRYGEDPSLGNWVVNQRKLYHQLKEDGASKMPENRIRLLEEIGFQWVKKKT